MALGVLAAAREKGISIPNELSIAGVDNTFISRISTPVMSTIDLRMGEVGAKAAELYRSLKKNNPAKQKSKLILPSLFCRRETF
jgi:LacI family transcriptional regulator